MSYAIYRVPPPGRPAERVVEFPVTDCAREARDHRREFNAKTGLQHAVHVGEHHPDELPFGERLWVESEGDIPHAP